DWPLLARRAIVARELRLPVPDSRAGQDRPVSFPTQLADWKRLLTDVRFAFARYQEHPIHGPCPNAGSRLRHNPATAARSRAIVRQSASPDFDATLSLIPESLRRTDSSPCTHFPA